MRSITLLMFHLPTRKVLLKILHTTQWMLIIKAKSHHSPQLRNNISAQWNIDWNYFLSLITRFNTFVQQKLARRAGGEGRVLWLQDKVKLRTRKRSGRLTVLLSILKNYITCHHLLRSTVINVIKVSRKPFSHTCLRRFALVCNPRCLTSLFSHSAIISIHSKKCFS